MRNASRKRVMVWLLCGLAFLVSTALPFAPRAVRASSERQPPSRTADGGSWRQRGAGDAGRRQPYRAAHSRVGKTLASGYRVTIFTMPPAAIDAVAPSSGPVGTSVNITGSGFTSATLVKFNGVSATFTVSADTLISAIVPSGATTGLIEVVTNFGAAASLTPFTVTSSSALTIDGFMPPAGPVGTEVIISGTGFEPDDDALEPVSGDLAVFFNGVEAEFEVISDSQILAIVPVGATTGPIKVERDDEMAVSSANFIVTAGPTPPIITNFTPPAGPVGTTVSIFGANFANVSDVRFNGVVAAFTVNSSTQITATVPTGATTGPITVTTAGGTATASPNFIVTTGPTPPAITNFSPTQGPIGAVVSIFGANFADVTNVRFNGVNATFAVNSATQITATVPTGATTGPISVTTRGGTATASPNFIVTAPVAPPTIADFSPTSGPVGAVVTITGTGFLSDSPNGRLERVSDVRFNGVNATFTVNSATQLTATVPAGATTGPISVTTAGGTATSATPFVVTQPPTILSFAPTAGPVGATVVITGANFERVTSVTFNRASATFAVNSPTQITATVPAGATTGLIAVTTAAGAATSQTPFVVTQPPTITSFTPTSGTVGATVTIAGTSFEGATSVSFGGVSASFSVNSPTLITAIVPIGAATGPIRVTTPAGTAISRADFTVTPRVPPQTVGVFRPNQAFLLRQSNTPGLPDILVGLGQPGDLPVVGDWDGDGKTTVALFRNGQFLIRNENATGAPVTTVAFGQPGDLPLAGDWTGKGFDSVGVFRRGVFLLRNSNTAGNPDIVVNYGLPTDLPVVGDWNGDGRTTIGAFRPSTGFFFLRNENTSGNADISFFYGLADDLPVAGDWDGDGVTTIGVFRRGTFFLRNTNTAGFADLAVAFGQPGDLPLAGRWKTPPIQPPGDFQTGNSTIVWRNRVTGQNAIWKMNGVNFVESVTLPTAEDCWVIGGAADFNSDGNTDLLWRNQDITGFDAVWTFSGTTPTASLPITPEQTDLNWTISCTGDVNRDGQTDIIRRNAATGAVEVWLMNGRARSAVVPLVISDLAPSEQIVGSGDFDQNGLLDLLVRNQAEGRARIVTLIGATAVGSRPLPALGPEWRPAAVGDYNRDGQPDIVWRNTATGQNVIWLLRDLALVQSVAVPAVPDQRWQIVGPR